MTALPLITTDLTDKPHTSWQSLVALAHKLALALLFGVLIKSGSFVTLNKQRVL